MNTTQYDVFVSYSHADKEWVRGVMVPKLEQRGFKVFIDYIDIRSGSFSAQEMERGVLESKRMIAVFTPDYIESDWSTFENVMAQTLDPAALQRRLIPVLRKKCNIPLRLSILHYRDLSDDQNNEQWELLVRDLI